MSMAMKRSIRSRGSTSPIGASPLKKAREGEEPKWDLLDQTEISRLPRHLLGNQYFVGNERQLLTLAAPKDYSLSQSICSYGYFCLAPNRWVPCTENDDEGYLVRPLRHGLQQERSTQVAVGQCKKQAIILVSIEDGKTLTREHLQQLVNQITRMLRLDMDLSAFYALHPEAQQRGFGRLYRSPTLFEDIIKTITNCNMKWSGTVDMNAKLCRHFGGAFPTALQLQQSSPQFLKEHCRLGYRSEWVWKIANSVVEGTLDLDQLEQIECSDELVKELRRLPGIGTFASNNLLHLMGFFDAHPYDTETIRLFKEDFHITGSSKRDVFEEAKRKYSVYQPNQFTAYWFDLWKNYEKRAGIPSPQWSIEQNESERPIDLVADHNCIFSHSPQKHKQQRKKIDEASK